MFINQGAMEKSCQYGSYSNSFTANARHVLRNKYRIFSTSLMRPSAGNDPYSDFKKYLFWKAYNPILCKDTLGSYFMDMMNNFLRVKYCGVKVVWKPNKNYMIGGWSNKATHFNFDVTNTDYHVDTSNYYTAKAPCCIEGIAVPHEEIETNPDWARTQISGMDYYPDESPYWNSPPHYRLWINFAKAPYASNFFYEEVFPIDKTQYADLASGDWFPSNNTAIEDCRVKMARVFDDYGQSQFDQRKIRSFDLRKPFKFYCRPKVVSQAYEQPAADRAHVREQVSPFSQVMSKNLPNSDVMVTNSHNYPYISTDGLFPYYAMYDGLPNYNDAWIGDVVVNSNMGGNYNVDPILFSWCLTRDDFAPEAYEIPIEVFSQYSDESKPQYWKLRFTNYLESIGRFKITFYTKWRQRNPNRFIPDSIRRFMDPLTATNNTMSSFSITAGNMIRRAFPVPSE
jgi:hypothetical protein